MTQIFTKEFAKIIKDIFEIGHKKVTIDVFPSGTYILSVSHNPRDD